jgi:hypothetical protein
MYIPTSTCAPGGRSRLELGEGDDLVEALADLGAREALDRAVQEDVLAAGEVRVEAGAELEQRADRPPRGRARGRLDDPGDERSSVVLPEPLRPMSPTASPGRRRARRRAAPRRPSPRLPAGRRGP